MLCQTHQVLETQNRAYENTICRGHYHAIALGLRAIDKGRLGLFVYPIKKHRGPNAMETEV